jgi:Tfp pilus assembly protein PilO
MTRALRRPAATGLLVALVLVGGWWKVLWQPAGAAITKAHAETTSASSNLLTVEQSIGHLKHLELISPKLAVLEQKLSAAAPANAGVDQFILTLNALSQQAGVDLGSISLSQPSAAAGSLSSIAVHFTVDGDYFAVQGFLDALRGTSRIVVIDSLAESPELKDGKTAGVSASLALHLLTGLVAPPPAVQQLLSPPTTKAPTGIISGPVTKAKNAVASANANTATINRTANSIGGP